MKDVHPVAKILVDSFNEAGICTEGFGFYDMMTALWLADETEAYDLVVKALAKDVITTILAKEE